MLKMAQAKCCEGCVSVMNSFGFDPYLCIGNDVFRLNALHLCASQHGAEMRVLTRKRVSKGKLNRLFFT